MNLSIYSNQCSSVFGLNRNDEDSATYSLGWTFTKSPTLLKEFIKVFVDIEVHEQYEQISIELQKSGIDKGFTDLEITLHNNFHIIVEAKRDWELPTEEQLNKYTSRFSTQKNNKQFPKEHLISMSAASEEYASRHLPQSVNDYPLDHISWDTLYVMASSAKENATSSVEKLWLSEFLEHIKGYKKMTNPKDNSAYCVVISKNNIHDNIDYTWIDVIEKDRCYFHPIGNSGFPSTPFNYVAFRWDGKLSSVHHIESFEVANNLNSINPNWPKTNTDHFIYKLGSPMRPNKVITNGKLYPTARIWCAIDTLLSGDYETISEARDETQRRES